MDIKRSWFEVHMTCPEAIYNEHFGVYPAFLQQQISTIFNLLQQLHKNDFGVFRKS